MKQVFHKGIPSFVRHTVFIFQNEVDFILSETKGLFEMRLRWMWSTNSLSVFSESLYRLKGNGISEEIPAPNASATACRRNGPLKHEYPAPYLHQELVYPMKSRLVVEPRKVVLVVVSHVG